jgi:hypothetical protein
LLLGSSLDIVPPETVFRFLRIVMRASGDKSVTVHGAVFGAEAKDLDQIDHL